MGKETKIGLAVIGLLFLVFGVLLFRKMTASDIAHSHDPAPPAAVAVPSSAADKPNLVETQHDSAERPLGEDRWSVRGRELDAESAAGAPPARFML